jgi:ERCC4-type nuclease
MFSLRCDYREDRGGCVITILKNLRLQNNVVPADKYELRDEVMTTGDYAIQYAGYVILVERKTWEDLAASIKDKRIMRNHEKMLAARDQGYRIMYLIEGRAPSPDSAATKIQGIPMANMMAKLDHFAMRDGVWVEYTRSATHTAQRLLELGKNMLTLEPKDASRVSSGRVADASGGQSEEAGDVVSPTESKSEASTSTTLAPSQSDASPIMRIIANPDEIIKKKYVQTTLQVREAMLACIPGVGDKTARALINAYPFPRLVMFKDIVGLSAFQSSELLALSRGERPAVVVAMLSCIKGVSPTLARIIAAGFTVERLATRDTLATASIGDVKVASTGRRIGSKLAERISESWSDEVAVVPATPSTVAVIPTSIVIAPVVQAPTATSAS